MSRGDLDQVQIMGRPFKPFAFFVALSMTVLIVFNIALNRDVLDGSLWGDGVGVIACVSTAALIVGWVMRSQRLAQIGLLLAAGTWMTRSFVILFMAGSSQIGFWLSLCWSGAAAGAYVLETFDGNNRGA